MFQEALSYPRDSDSAVKTIAIGGVLLLLSFLVVPVFFVFGYIVRTLRAVLNGEAEPPVFDDWGDLGMDGLKVFAIGFVYSLIPAAIALVAVFASGATLGLGGNGAGSGLAVGLIALVATLAMTVLSLAIAYVLPAAIVAYVRTDSIAAAFAPAELRRLAFSRTYATGWLVAFGISLLAGVVIGVLNAVVIGAVLVPFVTFYANVAGTYAVGTAVRDMPVVDAGDETPDAQPAA
ncbi:DUF4013 domain-containing protein [Haloarcula sebkhae]|uniref:DUF4013 domain-containing protein n=2 Tax=Haloarcula sebkhae TaxID=932660 RepID=A0A830ERI9_9EURY|nr:DUF4013 domain-containing protein [Haloarcula sebkhae]GGK66253.1 hypothetical protein GCM10009067_18420 [Haloarcula sebkhae]